MSTSRTSKLKSHYHSAVSRVALDKAINTFLGTPDPHPRAVISLKILKFTVSFLEVYFQQNTENALAQITLLKKSIESGISSNRDLQIQSQIFKTDQLPLILTIIDRAEQKCANDKSFVTLMQSKLQEKYTLHNGTMTILATDFSISLIEPPCPAQKLADQFITDAIRESGLSDPKFLAIATEIVDFYMGHLYQRNGTQNKTYLFPEKNTDAKRSSFVKNAKLKIPASWLDEQKDRLEKLGVKNIPSYEDVRRDLEAQHKAASKELPDILKIIDITKTKCNEWLKKQRMEKYAAAKLAATSKDDAFVTYHPEAKAFDVFEYRAVYELLLKLCKKHVTKNNLPTLVQQYITGLESLAKANPKLQIKILDAEFGAKDISKINAMFQAAENSISHDDKVSFVAKEDYDTSNLVEFAAALSINKPHSHTEKYSLEEFKKNLIDGHFCFIVYGPKYLRIDQFYPNIWKIIENIEKSPQSKTWPAAYDNIEFLIFCNDSSCKKLGTCLGPYCDYDKIGSHPVADDPIMVDLAGEYNIDQTQWLYYYH